MKPIAIFYHCLFEIGDPPEFLPAAFSIVASQMADLFNSRLMENASEFHVGINGGGTSLEFANLVLPSHSKKVLHGLQCKNECRTIRMLQEWVPGHEDWYVLYFHSKGGTKPEGDSFTGTWRRCMMRHTVQNWRRCVQDLDAGYESVGAHWMEPPNTPPGQYIFAGSFWWTKASFLATVPSIMERDRIKLSGIDSVESRYEAEVILGNGPRPPKIKDYHGPNWNPSKISTCA